MMKRHFTDTIGNVYKRDSPLFGNGIYPLYTVTQIGSSYLCACTYAFLILRIKSELPMYLIERASHNLPKIMHTLAATSNSFLRVCYAPVSLLFFELPNMIC